MSFGEKLLKKFGWKEGKGLGPQENGITDPLKANLKSNNLGIGYKLSEEFTNHWWDYVYNRTANSLSIKTGEDGQIKVEKDDSLKNKFSSKKERGSGYGRFVKGSVLDETGEHIVERQKHVDVKTEQTEEKAKRLSDDELFKYCGGLTGHKGARHGLKMSAKLARLAEQEKKYVKIEDSEILSYSNDTTQESSRPDVLTQNSLEFRDVYKRKKKKSKSRRVEDPDEHMESETDTPVTASGEAELDEHISLGSKETSALLIEHLDSTSKKKKKSKSRRVEDPDEHMESEIGTPVTASGEAELDEHNSLGSKETSALLKEHLDSTSKKKKKSKSRRVEEPDEHMESEIGTCVAVSGQAELDEHNSLGSKETSALLIEHLDSTSKKKKKKSKKKRLEDSDVISSQDLDSNLICSEPKKKKKKRSKDS